MAGENSTTDPPPQRYRLLILGGGAAGEFAARAAARRGVRTALVLPKAEDRQPAEPDGFAEKVRRMQVRFGLGSLHSAADDPNVDVHYGRPVFATGHAVWVGDRELGFRKALIAAGAGWAPAGIDGAAENRCLLPEQLDTLPEPPRRLAVIGSGAMACQWAQAFCRFGSRVHLVAADEALLPEEDPDAAAVIEAQFRKEDIRLYLGCRSVSVETTGNLHGVVIGRGGRREKLLVDKVLICTQQCPNTAGMALETALVACDRCGVLVDDRLRTTAGGIYAAGAVCGPRFASPAPARASAELAVANACRLLLAGRFSRLVIPRLVDTDPPLVQVGPTAGEAAERGIETESRRVDLADADRSLPACRRQGFVAMHLAKRGGRLVGITAAAADADELIAPLVLLMAQRSSPSALARLNPCRPGRMELLRRLGN